MSSNTLWTIIVIIIVVAGGWYFFSKSSAPAPAATNTQTSQQTTDTQSAVTTTTTSVTLMTSTGQLLSASSYARNAYEVYPTLDPVNGARALSGFDVQTQNLGGGNTRVTLVAKRAGYTTQSFVLGAGQKLYLIERSFGDDSLDQDENYGDDMGVAVDAQGNILQ